MTRSLYRDESWVANSVLSPTLHGMFYYDTWVQSTPPFFLLLVRGMVKLLGSSEVVLRLVPWLGGIFAAAFLGRVLLVLFPAGLAMLGTAIFISNYWVIKYSQQVKQYGTDLLVSAIFLFLLTSFLSREHNRRYLWLLVLAAGIGIFLSYTAVFWFLPSLIAVTWNGSMHASLPPIRNKARFVDLFTMSTACVTGFAVCEWLFLRPNQSASLTRFWIRSFIGSGGVVPSFFAFFRNTTDLMLPQMFERLRPVSPFCGLLILLGIGRALVFLIQGESRSKIVLLVTITPVVSAIAASLMRKYPLLEKPRVIIWMLPVCIVLVLFAVEPFWNFIARSLGNRTLRIATVCGALLIGAVAVRMGKFAATEARSTPLDDFRSGMIHIRDHPLPEATILVYALGAEEVKYYSHRLNWHPALVYVADTNLSCCVPGAPNVFGDDLRKDGLKQDVQSFFSRARGSAAWLLLQSGPHQNLILEQARVDANIEGCTGEAPLHFSDTIVQSFDCRSPGAHAK